MVNTRTVVAKCVLSGTLGGGTPNEIWSTSFWMAAYGEGGPGDSPDDMSGFDPSAFCNTQLTAFGTAMMNGAASFVTLTALKCNLVGLTAGKVKQITDPTVEAAVNVPGQIVASTGTYVTSVGFRLGSTTGSRGRGISGRMFLPPGGTNQNTQGPFDGTGHWAAGVLTQYGGIQQAWEDLSVGGGGSSSTGLTFLPSVVSVPKRGTGGTTFEVNAADKTTLESVVYVVRSRKSKIASGGNEVTHTSFA